MNEMALHWLMPDSVCHNAAISACEKGMQPKRLQALLEEMERSSLKQGIVCHGAIISVCEKCIEWARAPALL